MQHLRDVFSAWVPLSIILIVLVCLGYFVGRLIGARIRRRPIITNEELNRERTTVMIPLSLKDLK